MKSTFKQVLFVMIIIKLVSWILDLVLNKWGDSIAEIVGKSLGKRLGEWVVSVVLDKPEKVKDSRTSRGRSVVSYGGYFENDRKRRTSPMANYKFRNDFEIDTRKDAQQIRASLYEMVHDEGYACVADYKDLMGVVTTFADNKYGWLKLPAFISIVETVNGYKLDLPEPVKLD